MKINAANDNVSFVIKARCREMWRDEWSVVELLETQVERCANTRADSFICWESAVQFARSTAKVCGASVWPTSMCIKLTDRAYRTLRVANRRHLTKFSTNSNLNYGRIFLSKNGNLKFSFRLPIYFEWKTIRSATSRLLRLSPAG